MTLKQLMGAAIRLVRDQGIPCLKAMDHLEYHIDSLSKNDQRRAIKLGICHMIQNPVNNGTTMSAEYSDPGKIVSVEIEPYQEPSTINVKLRFLDSAYAVANGEQKKLIHFTLEDFQFVNDRREQQIRGLASRIEAFEYGAKMLVQHRAKTIEDLPMPEKEKFASVWENVVSLNRSLMAAGA